jgi:hypothetical protein
MSLSIIIVEKPGTLKSLVVKDFKEELLFKKCGFQKADGFQEQNTWSVKYNGEKIYIAVYGKKEGRANSENKYDFPPPIDNTLFFGSCAILAIKLDKKTFIDLTLEMWEKIYEKLFGGFEDLNSTALEDEDEIDELAFVPKEKKTKNGYLKDGFVVDSDGDEEEFSGDEEDDEEEDDDKNPTSEEEEGEEVINLEDIGSELSEEEYDYSEESA